jgi:hypothetical protein
VLGLPAKSALSLVYMMIACMRCSFDLAAGVTVFILPASGLDIHWYLPLVRSSRPFRPTAQRHGAKGDANETISDE